MSILGVMIGEREGDSGSSVRFAGVLLGFCGGELIELVAQFWLVILLFFPVPLRLRLGGCLFLWCFLGVFFLPFFC